ncbi:MAG: hypothetical protein ACKVPX_04165 [Myxococcaceae bacterium]
MRAGAEQALVSFGSAALRRLRSLTGAAHPVTRPTQSLEMLEKWRKTQAFVPISDACRFFEALHAELGADRMGPNDFASASWAKAAYFASLKPLIDGACKHARGDLQRASAEMTVGDLRRTGNTPQTTVPARSFVHLRRFLRLAIVHLKVAMGRHVSESGEASARRVVIGALMGAEELLSEADTDAVVMAYANHGVIEANEVARVAAFRNVRENADIGIEMMGRALRGARLALSAFERQHSVTIPEDEARREPFVDEVIHLVRYVAGAQKDIARELATGMGFDRDGSKPFVLARGADGRLHAQIPVALIAALHAAAKRLPLPLVTKRMGCPGVPMIRDVSNAMRPDAFLPPD